MTKVKGIYQRKDGRWEARYKKGIDEMERHCMVQSMGRAAKKLRRRGGSLWVMKQNRECLQS